MRNQLLEELAELYGIEVRHTSQGNGGLYYIDSNDIMKNIDAIFDEALFTLHQETISIEKCASFDIFYTTETNIPDAA